MATINGTSGPDTLTGTADADTINPLGGATNYVSGLAGNDTITIPTNTVAADNYNVGGGAGDDTIIVAGGVVNAADYTVHGDANVKSSDGTFDTTAAGTGTGTDTLKFNSLVNNTSSTSFTTWAPTGLSTIAHEANGVVVTSVDIQSVEKVEFLNGTIDLTNPNLQYFSLVETVDIAEDAASGDLNAQLLSFNGSTGQFTTDGSLAGWKISKVGGKAVTADGTVNLSGSGGSAIDAKIAGTRTTVEIERGADIDGAATGVQNISTYDVELTNATGQTVTVKVKVTDASGLTAGADTATGTSGDDQIDGLAGADTLSGGEGNDTIIGGAGNDSITAGDGNDRIMAGADNDAIVGGKGNDTIDGGAGTNTLAYANEAGGSVVAGAFGASSVTTSGNGTDTLANINTLVARNLGTTIFGEVMNEGTTIVDDANHNVDLTTVNAASTDTFGGETSVTISGNGVATAVGVGSSLFSLASGAVTAASASTLSSWNITGYARTGDANFTAITDDNLNKAIAIGDDGDITFTSRKLSDATQFTYSAPSNDVEANPQNNVLVLKVNDGNTDRHIIVDLKLNGENETVVGTDSAELLSGGDGNDNLSGGEGNDTLAGDRGTDTLAGGAGDDMLTGGDGNDNISGGDGNDTGNGGDGNDTIDGGKGNDTFFAGADDRGNDSMSGGEGDDVLGGGAGDDIIDGGAGANKVYGGADDDTLTLTSGDDSVHGASEGWGGEGDDTITGGSKNDVIGGGTGDDNITSGDGNDTIYGGSTGRETIDTGKGDDLVFASADRDTVTAGDGNDTVWGGAGNDTIDGGAGTDVIYGGADNDTIDGGAGNDTITGAAGNDNITGGSGADTFKFATGSGADTIADFKTADGDVLDLSGFGLASTTNILDITTEQTVSGNTGIILNLGNNDSIFLSGVTLSQIRDANIVWDTSA